MGLFDKKFCDICGNKIGLLGNRKLEDGNCCKVCAKKLSPWFDERRHSTVAQIKDQLAYREKNKQAVAAFNTTRSFGENYQLLYIDERARKFLVAGSGNFKDENPDVVDFSQVTSVNLDVRDSRRELKQKDAQGKEISYNPPRFEYEYDFYIVIQVNHPWFSEMRFKLNRNKLVIQELGAVKRGFMITQTSFDPRMSYEYQNYERMAKEMTDILQGSANAAFAQASPLGWYELDKQASAALKAGNRDMAISLYQQSIQQGGDSYGPLLIELQNKVSEPTSTDGDIQNMLDWANRAKAAGYDAAGSMIGLAQRLMTIRKMGVGPEVPWGEQLMHVMKLAQDEAMEAAGGQFKMPTQEEALAYWENSEEMAEYRKQAKFANMIASGATIDEALAALNAPAAASGAWTCSCGASNTGKFCEYCGSPRS